MVDAGDRATALLEVQEQIDDATQQNALYFDQKFGRRRNVLPALYERRTELVMAIPQFWLKALLNHPAFSLLITDRDSKMLRYLVDIRVSSPTPTNHPQDFEITFTFASNEYFKDQCLIKSYTHCDFRGRVVGVHDINWTDADSKLKEIKDARSTLSPSGVLEWISKDRYDASQLGELIKNDVYPRAIELYFGTYWSTFYEDEQWSYHPSLYETEAAD